MPAHHLRVRAMVLINGTKLTTATGFSVSRDLDANITRWSIDFVEPVEVKIGDLVSIMRNFDISPRPSSSTPATSSQVLGVALAGGSSGALLIENSPITSCTKSTRYNDLASSASGVLNPQVASTPIETHNNLALEKDLYFVNTDYVNFLAPEGWVIEKGAICFKNRQALRPKQLKRVLAEELPPEDVEVDTYECIIGTFDHYTVATHVANRIGLDFECNCPKLNVHRAFKIASSESVLQAITRLFDIWSPQIGIVQNIDKNGRPVGRGTLQVLDVAGPDQTKEAVVSINIPRTAIEVIDYNEDSAAESTGKEIVDHVIIKGAKSITTNTSFSLSTSSGDHRIRIDPLDLRPSETLSWIDSFTWADAQKIFTDYTGEYNKAGSNPPPRVHHIVRTENYWVDSANRDTRLLLEELSRSFTAGGLLIHQLQARHTYGQGNTLIGTDEKEWALVSVPGRPFRQFVQTRHKVVDQSVFDVATSRALCMEVIEEALLVTLKEVWADKARTRSKYIPCAAQPLVEAASSNAISSSAETMQRVWYTTTKARQITVNCVSPTAVRQVTTECDFLSGNVHTSTQMIGNPFSADGSEEVKESQLTEHFFQGSAPFHKAVEVEHPDIINSSIAKQVADRIFARSGPENADNGIKRTATIKLLLPLSLHNTAFTVNIPSVAYKVKTNVGYSRSGTVKGGKYVVSAVTENIAAEGGYDVTLSLRNVI